MSDQAEPTASHDRLASYFTLAAEIGMRNIAFAEILAEHPSFRGAEKVAWYHQLRRVRSVSDRPVTLVADETGLGKTAVVVLTKLLLDLNERTRSALLNATTRIELPRRSRRRTALVFATTSGMRDPWYEEEINAYVPTGFPRQHVLHIVERKDLDTLTASLGTRTAPDFAIVNYEKLAYPRYADALAQLVASDRVSLVAFDECHQIRNPSAKRFANGENGNASGLVAIVQRIRERAAPPRVLLLSATPIANLPHDLAILIHLLDPAISIPVARAVRRTDVLRMLFWNDAVFRIEKRHAQALLGLPDITETVAVIEPQPEEIAAYAAVWKQEVMCGYKLHLLAKACLAAKVHYLSSAIAQWRAEGKQVAIFTMYREDVTTVLAERFHAGRIDGTVPFQRRTEQARAFRLGDVPIIVATTKTSAESISLVTGDRPCVVVHLEPFFTPYETIQSDGRVWRPGQRAPVEVVTLVAQSPALAAAIERACAEIEDELCITRQRSWRPTSYDEDALAINREKRCAAEKVYANAPLTEAEEHVLTIGSGDVALKMASIAFDSPAHRACYLQGKWIGLGWRKYREQVIASARWSDWIADYNTYWEFTASAHTWRLIREVVLALEQRLGRTLQRIVDQGAGPGCGIRMLKRSMTAVDLSEQMLAVAQEEVERCNDADGTALALERVVRPLHDCGLPNNAFDLATTAYVLQYAQQARVPRNADERELEAIVRETNRILAPAGYWIVALPYNINGRIIERFEAMVEQYGFRVLPVSGFFKPTQVEDRSGNPQRPQGKFKGVWITVAQKQSAAGPLIEPPPNGLTFAKTGFAGGKRQHVIRRRKRKRFLHPERIVAFAHASGKRIEDLLDVHGA